MGTIIYLYSSLHVISILYIRTVTVGTQNSSDYSFIIIFAIIWGGGILITLNAQFLGARIGVCQSTCLLGYCVFPILLSAIINRITGSHNPTYGKVICVLLGYIWSCFCIIFILLIIISLLFSFCWVCEFVDYSRKEILDNISCFFIFPFFGYGCYFHSLIKYELDK